MGILLCVGMCVSEKLLVSNAKYRIDLALYIRTLYLNLCATPFPEKHHLKIKTEISPFSNYQSSRFPV